MSDFRIAVRLPVVIAVLVLVGVVTTSVFAYKRAATQLDLEAVRAGRIASLSDYIDGVRQDITVLAGNMQVVDAPTAFEEGWDAASNDIAENISGVASAAQNTAEGVTNSLNAANHLARMAGELQTLVGRFKYESKGGSGTHSGSERALATVN